MTDWGALFLAIGIGIGCNQIGEGIAAAGSMIGKAIRQLASQLHHLSHESGNDVES